MRLAGQGPNDAYALTQARWECFRSGIPDACFPALRQGEDKVLKTQIAGYRLRLLGQILAEHGHVLQQGSVEHHHTLRQIANDPAEMFLVYRGKISAVDLDPALIRLDEARDHT